MWMLSFNSEVCTSVVTTQGGAGLPPSGRMSIFAPLPARGERFAASATNRRPPPHLAAREGPCECSPSIRSSALPWLPRWGGGAAALRSDIGCRALVAMVARGGRFAVLRQIAALRDVSPPGGGHHRRHPAMRRSVGCGCRGLGRPRRRGLWSIFPHGRCMGSHGAVCGILMYKKVTPDQNVRLGVS